MDLFPKSGDCKIAVQLKSKGSVDAYLKKKLYKFLVKHRVSEPACFGAAPAPEDIDLRHNFLSVKI